ncbi:MAG: hypothetical protein E7082_07120 [Bacteroidales bacterium]|nr:hypothetical protein [Bacteroidales bacterium]
MKKICHFLICAVLGCMMSSCTEKDEPFEPQTYDIQGKVEKGPFISGSEISIQPMNSELQVSGSIFNTYITDDLGNFALGSKEFSSPYAEFIANGYFFNEVKGELSNGTLTLRALVDLQDNSTVNVNILTHLKYARIKNLVASGKNFDEANAQAQKELLNAFGLEAYSNNDVSSYSIISGTNESAALIAISSLLLMERTEAAFTEYISKLSADFGKNGHFSNEIQLQLSEDKKKLAKSLGDIRENIIRRYDALGIEVNVKELSHFIDWNNDGTAGNEILQDNQSVSLDKTSISIPNEGGKFTITLVSPISVFLESQVESEPEIDIFPGNQTLSVSLYDGYDESYFDEKEITADCFLNNNTLEISVSKLDAKTEMTKIISLYDYIGNVVASIELIQKGEAANIPASEVPLLGKDGEAIVNHIASDLILGLRQYNVIEQYYAYNKQTKYVNDYVYPGSSQIRNAWKHLYFANSTLLQFKKYDESMLNVYGDYCNVISALYYSNLIYGWGNVPYITAFSMLEEIIYNGICRESANLIFNDLTAKLTKAIDNLPEKKNESLKDTNGFFFASKDVARVLLANILMYQGNYNAAKDLLQAVVNNGFYQLDASKDFKPTTSSTEDIDVTQSSEVILAFQYNHESATRSSINITYPGVIPYITLSEVFLSLSECLCKLGDSITAEQYISKILAAKNLSSAETDVIMRIKDVREQILLHNGTYFAFLKRTGLAKDICGIEDYRLLFPIPDQEMFSNNKMTQNPGY